jgi:hypothetical protein
MFRKRKPSEGLQQARHEVRRSQKSLDEALEIAAHLEQIAKENHFADMIIATLSNKGKI